MIIPIAACRTLRCAFEHWRSGKRPVGRKPKGQSRPSALAMAARTASIVSATHRSLSRSNMRCFRNKLLISLSASSMSGAAAIKRALALASSLEISRLGSVHPVQLFTVATDQCRLSGANVDFVRCRTGHVHLLVSDPRPRRMLAAHLRSPEFVWAFSRLAQVSTWRALFKTYPGLGYVRAPRCLMHGIHPGFSWLLRQISLPDRRLMKTMLRKSYGAVNGKIRVS